MFEFNGVVFGKNSAPMESQFVAKENARRNQDRYPLAAETVLKSTYIVDSIDSVENDEERVELYRQLKALWEAANMHPRKWISISPEVMEKIPREERATEIVIDSGQDPMTKTLGTHQRRVYCYRFSGFSWISDNEGKHPAQNSNYFRSTGILYVRTLLSSRSYFRSCGCEDTVGTTKYRTK